MFEDFIPQPRTCTHTYAKEPGVHDIKERIELSVDNIALIWNPGCNDILDEAADGSYAWGAQWSSFAMTQFADLVSNKDESCGGCDNRFRPLCKSGRCVAPNCDDAAALCHDWSTAGKLARMYCPVQCGCDSLNSSLMVAGAGSGCPPPCLARFREAGAKLPCVDALPGSTELMAYADMVAENPEDISGVAKLLRSNGCGGAVMSGLNACGTQVLIKLSGDDMPFGLKGYKSIKHLCPVTCGCTHGKLGCPESCPRGDAAL